MIKTRILLQKCPLPGLFFNLPGRGVLRFSWPGYRNPVHFLAFFAKNYENSPD